MKLHYLIFSTILGVMIFSNSYGSQELIEKEELSQSQQIKRDGALLRQILSDNNEDPTKYDIRYSQIIDPLMDSLQLESKSKETSAYQKIKSFYEQAKKEQRLNLVRMTWLSGILSAVLTPNGSEFKPDDSIVSSIIQTFHSQRQTDFSIIEHMEYGGALSALARLSTASLFFAPLPVYIGRCAFSLEDYFWATSHGLYLYSINSFTEKKHVVHGGVFSSPLERTAHDIGHFLTQWSPNYITLSTREKEVYKYAASSWKKLAQAIHILLESNDVDITDKQRLKVAAFLIMHENDGKTVPIILSGVTASSVEEFALIAAYDWQESKFLQLTRPKVLVRHLYYHNFYRDYAYLLINNGLARFEDFGVQGNKLGTDYDLMKLQSVIKNLNEWFMTALENGGVLYQHFQQFNITP